MKEITTKELKKIANEIKEQALQINEWGTEVLMASGKTYEITDERLQKLLSRGE